MEEEKSGDKVKIDIGDVDDDAWGNSDSEEIEDF